MLIGSVITYGDALSILYEVHVIGNHSDRDKVLLKKSCHEITPAAANARSAQVLRNSPQAMPLTGFCGFLVLIEMKFWYARMIFRSYAPTRCFLDKGKVSVLLEGYRSPPAITNFIISACGGIFEPMSISPKLQKNL